MLYLNRSPKSTAIPLQKHGTTPNTTFKIFKSHNSMPLCMPGRLDRDNSSDTQYCTNLSRKNHHLLYGTGIRIEEHITSRDKKNRTTKKPQITKRLPRGSLLDLVEWLGDNLSRGFGGDRGRWGGEEDLTADARLGLHRPCSAPRFPYCFATYTCSSKWISGNTDAGGRGVGGVTSPDLEGEVGGV